ncbi:MAG: hypothetical protein SGJ07_14805 [Rhodospirillaceae bacterium]|nr:hypothetical protein [Rhodospirillaceae bacterium]
MKQFRGRCGRYKYTAFSHRAIGTHCIEARAMGQVQSEKIEATPIGNIVVAVLNGGDFLQIVTETK